MRRTRIKFCGITRLEDALAAAELGADVVGLVLHADSPRRVSRDDARKLMHALPAFVTPVGLFVNAPLELLLEIVGALGLRHVQLHGHETPTTVAALSRQAVVKAIQVSRDRFGDELRTWRGVANLRALLLDSGGGSGAVNDWQTIREHQQAGNFKGLPPIIAAGGLRPDNVAQVVRLLRPWAVDVSSGIETSPGVKSHEKMAAFVEAVRAADLEDNAERRVMNDE